MQRLCLALSAIGRVRLLIFLCADRTMRIKQRPLCCRDAGAVLGPCTDVRERNRSTAAGLDGCTPDHSAVVNLGYAYTGVVLLLTYLAP